jgi:phosphoglycolate phosphatase-like HAD superfamily hydrolase
VPTSEKNMLEVKQINEYYFIVRRAGKGLELLPGVKALLEVLRDTPNVQTALVTGNLEAIGWSKMDALGIGSLFTAPRSAPYP